MDPIIDMIDFFGDGETIDDDGLLGDLHLGSAINLDRMKWLIERGNLRYNMCVPEWEQNELQDIESKYPRSIYEYKVEVIPTLLKLNSRVSQELKCLPTNSLRTIWKILKENLKHRGIDLPLCFLSPEDDAKHICVSTILLERFDNLTGFVCYRSELIRQNRQCKFRPKYITERNNTIEMEIDVTPNDMLILGSKRNLSYCVHKSNHTLYLFNFEVILLFLDNLGQRICAEASSRFGGRTNIPGTIRFEIFQAILETGDKLLDTVGNTGYDQIAMFESLCVGELLRRNPDGITDPEVFLNNCRDEMLTGFEEVPIVSETYNNWMELLGLSTPEEISNLFCLYRCWGHPIVDIYAGMEKVYKIATQQKIIVPMIGDIILYQFRKMYLTSFRIKHNKYPPVKISGDNYVTKSISEGLEIHTRHPEYNFLDYKYVEIQQVASIPISYDICHILNDKAVSPNLDELTNNVRNGKGTNCGGLRRGIVRWMCGNTPPCREFLNDIDKNGFCENELLTGMYEKERELKVAARMYTLMTENMRYYFVLTEEMIANEILPYFPEITMKDSLNVLIKKLWNAGGRRSKGSIDVNVNIDFSKWNTNMRSELSFQMFQEMDHMFGMNNLISRTHDVFKNSLVYSCSGTYNPIIGKDNQILEDPPMCYRGHLGGFEGLRQKGWTIATVCLLVYTADLLGLKCNLMGQGDNQIIRLQMPKYKWESGLNTLEQMKIKAREKTDRMVNEMDTNFKLAGLPLKVRETWSSSRLFMYGKIMLLDGEQLPQWYKKVLRSYALSNEGTLTISGIIGVVSTNMCAAAGASMRPDLIYLLFLSFGEWSLNHLFSYHPFTRAKYSDGDTNLVKLPGNRESRVRTPPLRLNILTNIMLTVPTAIGGSIVIPLTSYIFRGFPDKASEGYAWVRLLSEGGRENTMSVYYKNFFSFLKNDSIELDMLIQSPLSLNHKRPPTPGLQSREIVRDWLLAPESFPNNRFLQGMKVVDSSFSRKLICKSLCPPVTNPIIAHEVYETYPHVYLDGFCRRIENTRTIKNIRLQSSNRPAIIRRLMDSEDNFIWYLWWRAHKTGTVYSSCATKQARVARTIGWGRKIVGVTTPHPLELTTGNICREGKKCEITSDFLYTKVSSSGDFAPYLGSKIRVKVSSGQDEEAGREPLILRGSRLAKYVNWISLGQNYLSTVIENVKAICDTSIFDNFIDENDDDMHSGSLMHRFLPGSISEGCFINYSPQVGHKVFMSSDNMPNYGRGQTNYTLHFQALYCWVQYITHFTENTSYYHHHLECEHCIVPVEDDFDDMEEISTSHLRAHNSETIKKIREILGYLDEVEKLVLNKRDPPSLGVRIKLEETVHQRVYRGLIDLCSYKAAREILSSKNQTSVSVGFEDLQGFPRIYAYKLKREDIIAKTCIWMLLLLGVREDKPPVDAHLSVLKKRAQNLIMRMSTNNLSLLAALCLGRGPISEISPVMLIEGTSFPETTSSILSQVQQSMILSLSRVTFSKKYIWAETQLPNVEITDDILMGIFSMKSLYLYKCTELFRLWGEMLRGEKKIVLRECGHRCQIKCYRNTQLVSATMDRMIKSLPVVSYISKSLRRDAEYEGMAICHPVRVSYGKNVPDVAIFLRSKPQGSNKLNIIVHPTSSIYRWDPLSWFLKREYHEINHIIVLGDGTGGSSLCLASRYGKSNVFPLAKLEKYEMIPQDLMSMMPTLSRGLNNVSPLMMMNLPDNVLSNKWSERFRSEMKNLNGRIIVCSDMEGSGGGITTISEIIRALITGTVFALKTYTKDLAVGYKHIKNIDNLRVVTFPTANLMYGECWIIGEKVMNSCYASTTSLERALTGINESETDQLLRVSDISAQFTERRFPELVKLSISITLSRVTRLGIFLGPSEIILPSVELVSYFYQYLNTHYHFAGKVFSPGNKRMISQKLKKDLEEGVKILLFALVEHTPGLYEQLPKLTLINVKRGIQGRHYFNILFNYSSNITDPLEREIIRDGSSLQKFRASKGLKPLRWEKELGSPYSHGLLKGISELSFSTSVGTSSGVMETDEY